PADVRVCIATPHAPRISVLSAPVELTGDTASVGLHWPGDHLEPMPSPFAGFEIVRIQPAASWISALIGWAAARVKPGGGFDAARIERLLGDPASQRMFETPGELIGFLGMIDVVGVGELEAKTGRPLWWIRAWLKALVERPDRALAPGIRDL